MMKPKTLRMRMFAGPNGSGKSTIKDYLPPKLWGVYVNADEIEKNIKQYGIFNFNDYKISTSAEDILKSLEMSGILIAKKLIKALVLLEIEDNLIIFDKECMINAYFAAAIADIIRHKLLELKRDFTFETVMSSDDKVALLKKAQDSGFKTYLYYIATDDPLININRVENRVKSGGHHVDKDKIDNRYSRSLDLLLPAIRYSNRAFIFDSSAKSGSFQIAVIEEQVLEFKVEQVPYWFMKAIKRVD